MRHRLAVALCLIVALSGAAHSTPRYDTRFATKINNARAEADHNALEQRDRLARIALRHTHRMIEDNELRHSRCLPCHFKDREWNYLGENVGVGRSVSSLHRAFMQSGDHRRVILFGGFDYVGVGAVRARGRLWVTEVFLGV